MDRGKKGVGYTVGVDTNLNGVDFCTVESKVVYRTRYCRLFVVRGSCSLPYRYIQ